MPRFANKLKVGSNQQASGCKKINATKIDRADIIIGPIRSKICPNTLMEY